MLWAPLLHGSAGLSFSLLSSCFKPFICASQEGWQCGGFSQSLLLSRRFFYRNIALMAVEEAAEHDQGLILDLKKCMLVQRHSKE